MAEGVVDPSADWDDSQKQRIIAMVCSDPPEGRARWTVRLVVEGSREARLVPRVGRETVRVLLLHHDLKPAAHIRPAGPLGLGESCWRRR